MELTERVASLETEMENIKDWQKKQNGCLQGMENKLNKIYFWIMTVLGGVSVSLVLLIIQITSRR